MFQVARVQDVIMDPLHPKYMGQTSIGSICYTLIDDPPPENILQCETASPLNTNINHIPIPNEIVFLVSAPSKNYNENENLINYYLYPHAVFQDPNSNALPNAVDSNNNFYKGNFIEMENIRPLVPFDGDILFEGRFGNSMRFGSTNISSNTFYKNEWSNTGTYGDPITIIRNGQQALDNRNVNNFDHIIENINKDDSSIYLCSRQKILAFQPASLHDGSYNTDIFKQNSQTNEPEIPNNELTPDIQEDINLNSASPPPPKDKQITSELSNFKPSDVAYYDISPTETQILSPQDTLILPNSYIVPDTTNMNYLMEEI